MQPHGFCADQRTRKHNTMNHLTLQKTFLQGKQLLFIFLLTFFSISVFAQTNSCKADFTVDIDQNTKTVTLKARSNKSPAVFGWRISDGTFVRGESITHTFQAAGEYKICLTAIAFDSLTNQRCTTDICKTVSLVDCDRLEARFTFETNGLHIALKADANSKDAVFGYDMGDGTFIRGQFARHTYDKPGVYEVCLLVKDTVHACKTRICKKVVIEDNDCELKADFEFRQDNRDFKFLARANANEARYIWDFGDGETAYGKETAHRYREAGEHLVCLTVLSKQADSDQICRVKICKRVQIDADNPCKLKADFDFRTDKLKAGFIARSNEENVLYFWSFGDGTSGTGKEIRHRYEKAGVYEVCLIVFNPKTKCKVCVCKRVIIEKPCKLKAYIISRQHLNKFVFKARTNASANASYSWDFGDGTTATGKAVRHTYANRGIYELSLTITDRRAGCKITVTEKVYVGLRNATAITTNSTVIEKQDDVLNTEPETKQAWTAQVSPVPATSTISISAAERSLESIKVYSMDGTLALTASNKLYSIDISGLAKGMYYAHVYANDGSFSVVKFIKE